MEGTITPPTPGQGDASKPGIGDLVLSRITARTPGLEGFKPSGASAQPEGEKKPDAEGGAGARPEGDKKPGAEDGEGAKPQGEKKPDAEGGDGSKAEGDKKPGAEGGDGEGDSDEEIAEGDPVETQLEKLRKAQKKTLKRIDSITNERNELRRQLDEINGASAEPITTAPALAHINTLDDLQAEVGAIKDWVKTLHGHTKEGYTYKGRDGAEVSLSPEDVVNEIIYWTEVQANQVPAHRQFIETRDRTRAETAEKFKPWMERKGFTDAKAEVEKTMRQAQSVLPDYDQAVHERALGRLALSGEFELVPKRKAQPAGVESAPAKKKPEAPPSEPPNSGGPPIRPTGSGPDVEALRQKMLKEPGNAAARKAYLQATLGKGRAA